MKINLSFSLINHNATKTYRLVPAQNNIFLSWKVDADELSASRTGDLRNQLDRSNGGSQSPYGGDEKNFCLFW